MNVISVLPQRLRRRETPKESGQERLRAFYLDVSYLHFFLFRQIYYARYHSLKLGFLLPNQMFPRSKMGAPRHGRRVLLVDLYDRRLHGHG